MKKVLAIFLCSAFYQSISFAVTKNFENTTGIITNYDENNLPVKPPRPNGKLDITFGTDGVATAIITGKTQCQLTGAITDQYGRIVAVGSCYDGAHYIWTVARFNSDGSIDESFGTGGYVIDTFPATYDSAAEELVIDSENRIIVVGEYNDDIYVARYLSNGALDETFSSGDGTTIVSVSGATDSIAQSVALDSEERIIGAGICTITGQSLMVVFRLDANGDLDTDGFNAPNGYLVTTQFGAGSTDVANAVAMDSSDRPVVVGSTTLAFTDMAIARLTSAGLLDTTFNGTGQKTIRFAGGASAGIAYTVLIDQEGRILIGGGAAGIFTLVRLLSTGDLDTTFLGSGTTTYTFAGLTSASTGIVTMDFDPFYNIFVSGTMQKTGADVFVVAKFGVNGDLDTAFGGQIDNTGGTITPTGFSYTHIGGSAGEVFGGAFDQQARVIPVGGSGNNFALAAYLTSYTLSYYQAQFAGQALGLLGS